MSELALDEMERAGELSHVIARIYPRTALNYASSPIYPITARINYVGKYFSWYTIIK